MQPHSQRDLRASNTRKLRILAMDTSFISAAIHGILSTEQESLGNSGGNWLTLILSKLMTLLVLCETTSTRYHNVVNA